MKFHRILTLAILTVALFALSGCTSTNVESQTFKIKRTSFLQRVDIAEASANPDGTFLLRGYKSDGGNEALANALVTMAHMMASMQAAQGMQTQPATVVPPSSLRSAPPLRNTPPPAVQPAFPAPNSAP